MSTEKLIEVVYKFPQLYDRNHRDFRKNHCKQRIWKTVARQLGSRNGDQIRRKWKNLRDTYVRLLKANSEEGAVHKQWIWSKRMEAFRPFLTLPPSPAEAATPEHGLQSPEVAAESEDSEHEEDGEEEEELRPGCPPTPPHNELITCDMAVSCEPAIVPKQEIDRLSFHEHPIAPAEEACKRRAVVTSADPQAPVIAYLESRAAADELDSLFLAYAMTVRKFSPRRQVVTKLKMAQLIAEEELAHVEEAELVATQACNQSTLQ